MIFPSGNLTDHRKMLRVVNVFVRHIKSLCFDGDFPYFYVTKGCCPKVQFYHWILFYFLGSLIF
jgi:hypothetical protein